MNPINLDFELNICKAEETSSGKWIVEGFASTTDFDMQDDIITQQAIEDSAKDLIISPTVLFNHIMNEPIGKVLETKATKSGLWIKVFISKTVPKIWKQIQEGVICKFSIRGKILDAKKKWISNLNRWVQVIFKMQLAEVSMVSVAGNPQARALRWYIQKSLENYYNQGNDLEIIKEGGSDMSFNLENYLDEILPAKGEEVEKSIQKAGVMDMLDSLIAAEKDPAKKKKLQELKDAISKYPKPGAGEKYPMPKGMQDKKETKKDNSEVGFEELLKNTDPEVIELLKQAIEKEKEPGESEEDQTPENPENPQEEEVQKGGRKISVKSQDHLNEVVGKLDDAIRMIKELIGKADEEKVEKLLERFESIKQLIGNKTNETKQDSLDSFEKLAEIQLGLAQKSNDTTQKIDVLTEMMSKLFKGVGAVRNEDGTISFGKEAIKGLEQRTDDPKNSANTLEVLKSSDQYSKADLQGKRELLTETIGAFLTQRRK